MSAPGVTKHTSDDDLTWYRRHEQAIVLADALDGTDDVAMTVGFARYGPGEANPWTTSYDEALVITSGRFTVESGGRAVSAGPGEVIFLRRGTELVYKADEETELVYVTYPHWAAATEQAGRTQALAEFQPVNA